MNGNETDLAPPGTPESGEDAAARNLEEIKNGMRTILTAALGMVEANQVTGFAMGITTPTGDAQIALSFVPGWGLAVLGATVGIQSAVEKAIFAAGVAPVPVKPEAAN